RRPSAQEAPDVKQSLLIPLAASWAWVALSAAPLSAQTRAGDTLASAAEVLEALQTGPLNGIPAALLADAQGVAIIPGVVKVGFVVGGRFGRGVVLARNPDGTWGGPVFVTLGGGGVGWQAGVQSTDLVLVFRTRSSVERLLRGRGKFTLGADASVA